MLFLNIQVGLNMHLYDDIGDASSSLRGSTSSFLIHLKLFQDYLLLLIYFQYSEGKILWIIDFYI